MLIGEEQRGVGFRASCDVKVHRFGIFRIWRVVPGLCNLTSSGSGDVPAAALDQVGALPYPWKWPASRL